MDYILVGLLACYVIALFVMQIKAAIIYKRIGNSKKRIETMKYKVGDKVRIRSLDWYNKNRDRIDEVVCGKTIFIPDMVKYCGEIVTISDVRPIIDVYHIKEDGGMFSWTDEMFEGLVEEEMSLDKAGQITDLEYEGLAYTLPDGYIFKDENGNEILTNKIILEKVNTLKIQSDSMETETHRGYCTTEEDTTNKSKKVAWFTFGDNDFADKVELDLSNRELIQEDGKWFVVKKKPKYPKTYEECCEVLGLNITHSELLFYYPLKCGDYTTFRLPEMETLEKFIQLYLCRNAYWKIAGEEMGLVKPWKPTKDKMVYSIYRHSNKIETDVFSGESVTFEFPTKEMRDVFYENFKEDIEKCKEFL